jgi:hypothetical protein
MNNLHVRKLFYLLLVVSFAMSSCNIRIFHRDPEKQLFGKSRHVSKEIKAKEPRKVLKAKKKQEAKSKKLDREYEKSIVLSQKRTIQIQTPEVKERMKQDKINTKLREKEKKKKERKSTKKAEKIYN